MAYWKSWSVGEGVGREKISVDDTKSIDDRSRQGLFTRGVVVVGGGKSRRVGLSSRSGREPMRVVGGGRVLKKKRRATPKLITTLG